MEPPKGLLATLWNFFIFLPFFIGLLLLGIIKGIIICPLICAIMTIGNSAIIVGLWPAHSVWTYYCILRANRLGPILKLILCPCIIVVLILWLLVGIVGSIIGSSAYGFLAPIFATFKAVGEGKTNEFFHCIYDGTWSTFKVSFMAVRDFMDICFHSYFSFMDELRCQRPPDGKIYEIRLLYLPGAILGGLIGIAIDIIVISLIGLLKSPYMLFKGWHRLFHDLIGREGPFLETICVPFAGLAILLWPLAVVGAVLGSILSSLFLGAYAGVIVYQESSFWLGLCYVIASLSLFDEYSNDVLDMSEGSCFPRPRFRKKVSPSQSGSRTSSFSRSSSFKEPPSRSSSLKGSIIELKPFELLDDLFIECRRYGDMMTSQGLIMLEDIEDSKSRNTVICVGLPSFCLLQALIRSVKANSDGFLLSDGIRELTSKNRPRDTFFDWFLNPLLVIKDQIKAASLSEPEEEYLGRLILFNGNSERLKNSNIGMPPTSERKQAELEAFARRLRGIMVSISRYPTFKRRFDTLLKALHDDLCEKNGGSLTHTTSRVGGFVRMISQKSFKNRNSFNDSDHDSSRTAVEIS